MLHAIVKQIAWASTIQTPQVRFEGLVKHIWCTNDDKGKRVVWEIELKCFSDFFIVPANLKYPAETKTVQNNVNSTSR